ncbi:MAG: hypothetical protein AAF841_08530 [Pseudomonadota bacterium]
MLMARMINIPNILKQLQRHYDDAVATLRSDVIAYGRDGAGRRAQTATENEKEPHAHAHATGLPETDLLCNENMTNLGSEQIFFHAVAKLRGNEAVS